MQAERLVFAVLAALCAMVVTILPTHIGAQVGAIPHWQSECGLPGYRDFDASNCTDLAAWAMQEYCEDSPTGISGTLDASFGGGFVATSVSSHVGEYRAIAIDSAGRVIAGGYSGDMWSVARYSANGTLDTSFGTGGLAYPFGPTISAYASDVVVDGQDRILTVGSGLDNDTFTVVRFTSAGQLDPTFGTNGVAGLLIGSAGRAVAITLQTDGKIVASGDVFTGKYRSIVVMRFNTDGSLDTASFGTPNSARDIRKGAPPYKGYIVDAVNSRKDDFAIPGAIALQPNGRILIGHKDTLAPNPCWSIIGYAGNGRDTTFGVNGILKATTYGPFDRLYLIDIAVLADGRILASGNAMDDLFSPPEVDGIVVRYHVNGALDESFGVAASGISGVARTSIPAHVYGNQIAIQTGGQIVLGSHIYWEGSAYFMVFRFDEEGRPDLQFGTGGRSDLASYEPGAFATPRGLALDSTGGIFQCGATGVTGVRYVCVVKYNQ